MITNEEARSPTIEERPTRTLTADEARQSRMLLRCALLFFGLCMATLLALSSIAVLSGFYPIPDIIAICKILFLVATIAGGVGFIITRVVRNSFSAASDKVLTPTVRELLGNSIKDATDPITEFTRLSSLVGATGIFRKLELSGMPLATILMTLTFCILPIVVKLLDANEVLKDSNNISMAFIDMAKLTLGAFIGSFVTKSSSRDTDTARASASAAAKAIVSTQKAGRTERNDANTTPSL